MEFSSSELQRLRRGVRAWYDKNARDLPWRRTHDPYLIWISEIMLQQTTVAAVVPFYERFLSRFPTVEALAQAPEEQVLRAWEGLGYYSRARNIHKTAKIIAARGGEFPRDPLALLTLPGVGRYTAGAIASFAFDVRAPIVEANTLRLYSRLIGYRGDPRSTDGQHRLWEFAEAVLPQREPGRFNQALMELGATVCTPVAPRCEECPASTVCRAFAAGTQQEIPVLTRRPEVTNVVEASVAVRRGTAFLLRRRSEKERWAGLWDFPRFPLGEAANNGELATSLTEGVAVQTGIQIAPGELLTEIEHSVTRYRITLRCFAADYRDGAVTGPNLRWVEPADFSDYPLSVTGRKLARLIADLENR